MSETATERDGVYDSLREKVPALDELRSMLERDARDVDRAPAVPPSHVDALAAAGLYGALGPLEFSEMTLLVEALASACLTTTFVWLQHFRLLRAASDPGSPAFVRDRLARIAAGQIIGGISLSAALPGPPRLRASTKGERWVLTGTAPWVSGWGLVNLLVVTARTDDDRVLSCVLDARDAPGLVATPLRLSAMNASSTVTLSFEEYVVPVDRVLELTAYEPGPEAPDGLRVNGSLALGVARRCTEAIGPSPLDDRLLMAREALARADVEEIGAARARAAALAVRCAQALCVERGSASAISGISASGRPGRPHCSSSSGVVRRSSARCSTN